MRVFCYWNLHKACWSVRAAEGPQRGRVVAHMERLTLTNCTLKVSEAGRQRVLREGRKNVHAGVVGEWVEAAGYVQPVQGDVRLHYNPYRAPWFYQKAGDVVPRFAAGMVSLTEGGQAWEIMGAADVAREAAA